MWNRAYRVLCIAGLILLANIPQWAWGEPVTTIRNNGDSANRVDFVVLGDGYTAGELGKYAADVENAVNGFFNQEPFKEYQSYFNVHRVDVISNESGADHPERNPQVFKDTAFDATYNCSGIQRLICVDTTKVNTVLNNSVNPLQRDVVLVIVNDPEYGGSGGAIAVASTHTEVIELILHEEGHGFGGLADEYAYPAPCNNVVEPSEPNVTKEAARNLIKWNVGGGPPTGWIEVTTPIPTTETTPGVPGLYEGAKYCPNGLYRPTYNSKMRSLGVPFEQINEEQLVKRIYNWVSPLESSNPANTNLTLWTGQGQLFQVTVPSPLTHSLEVTWSVDGQFQTTGLQFMLDSTRLDTGYHAVDVLAKDPTSKVRNDPTQNLTEQRNWRVGITSGEDLIITSINGPTNAAPGDTITISDTVLNQGSGGADSFSVGLYLSPDSTITTSDIFLGSRPVNGLAGGTSSIGTTTVTTPTTVAPRTYYLGAIADDSDVIAETDEANNARAGNILAVSRLDLLMTQVIPNAASVNAGATLSVTDTVRNQGTASATNFRVGYVLSLDTAFGGTDDVSITTTRFISSLAAGASNTATTNLAIPSTTKGGNYYVCAKADSANAVTESKEDNNTLCSSSQVTVPPPDLIMTAVSTATTAVAPGKTLSLSNTVKNQGGSSKDSDGDSGFVIGFHLSVDREYGGTDDIAFTTTRSVSSLGVGASSTGSTTLTVPTTTPLGNYYVCAMADSGGAVAEGNEDNNSLCTASTIQVTRSDLVMTTITPNASTVNRGGTLSVTDTVLNQGLVSTGVSFRIGYRLSLNTVYGDADDKTITTTRSVSALAAGASNTATAGLSISSTTPVGIYFVCAKSDSAGAIPETDEDNNTRCSDATVMVQ